jgi:hypothetical protein
MLNIFDRNDELKPPFQAYMAGWDDGETSTGMIQVETANRLMIRKANGTSQTILRVMVEELKRTQSVVHAGRTGDADRRQLHGRSVGVSEFDQIVGG